MAEKKYFFDSESKRLLKESYTLRDYLEEEGFVFRRSGSRYTCHCPNPDHHDKHDGNFVVSENGMSGNCFACGEKGDVFHWIRMREGLNFYDACVFIAGRLGILDQFGAEAPKDKSEIVRVPTKEQLDILGLGWGEYDFRKNYAVVQAPPDYDMKDRDIHVELDENLDPNGLVWKKEYLPSPMQEWKTLAKEDPMFMNSLLNTKADERISSLESYRKHAEEYMDGFSLIKFLEEYDTALQKLREIKELFPTI